VQIFDSLDEKTLQEIADNGYDAVLRRYL